MKKGKEGEIEEWNKTEETTRNKCDYGSLNPTISINILSIIRLRIPNKRGKMDKLDKKN